MALKVVVNTDLNIRSGSGTENDIIGSAPSGCSYDVSGVKKDGGGTTWYKIGDGWVCGSYCDVSGTEDASGNSTVNQVATDVSATVGQVVSESLAQSVLGSGLTDTLSALLGTSLGSNTESTFFQERIFGAPYQFLASTDTRPGDNSNLGRIFSENILSEAPLLSLMPCKPNYLPSLNAEEKKNTFIALNNLAGELVGDTAKEAANDQLAKIETKYFTAASDHTEYMKYVNLLCRASAMFMGLGSLNVPGTETPYNSYNWANFRLSNIYDNSAAGGSSLSDWFKTIANGGIKEAAEKVKQTADGVVNAAKNGDTEGVLDLVSTKDYYVNFFVTPSTSYSESYSNRTEASAFEGLVNKGSDMIKEFSFLLGAGGVDAGTYEKSIANFTKELQGEMSKFIGGKDSILSRVLNSSQIIITGSNITFPEIYHDSEYSKSYRAEVHLIAPYGTRECIYLNIVVPLMHLLAFTLPRQTSVNSYGAPFLVKGNIRKWFSCEMGIIDTMEVSKGGQGDAWSVEGFPTEVTVSIGLKDLYSSLSMSKMDDLTSAYMFIQNESLMEYLAVICGLDLRRSEYKLKTDMATTLLGNMPTDLIDNTGEAAKEEVSRKAASIFRDVMGGRV